MERVVWHQWGLIPYEEAWRKQEEIFDEIVTRKVSSRDSTHSDQNQPIIHHLITCSHPHVYTLGKSAKEDHLLKSREELLEGEIEVHRINRGGDITYHGPGQLVAYPILDLEHFFTDIHKYLRYLEESIILTLSDYGIRGMRYPGYTGVWLDAEDPTKARKICAMGVRCSRWVTMHGLAFNINTELDYFNHIVPCGIRDKQVTSLEKELGFSPGRQEIEQKWAKHFAELFGCDLVNSDNPELVS